ncbi:MAG: hypothetical protein NTW25_08945 [Candidatus Kapabacteria bacterium]|nr:hypothetical protein [Candidatus Kapabacteria bacterium]
MKKIIILILILLSNAESKEFEYYPLGIDFNGIVKIKNKVICYGTYSAYLVSSDNGLNWNQKSIYGEKYDLEENINKLVNFNDTLWGVTSQSKIIKSIDAGETWEKYDLKQLNSYPELEVNNEYILYKTDGKIIFYDRNFKILKEIKNSFLLNNKTKNNTFSKFGNYLTYFNFDSLKFYTYDFNSEKENIFDLVDTNICKNCGSKSYSNIGKDIIIKIENCLYIFENYLKSYSKVVFPKNTLFGKFYSKNDSLFSVIENMETSSDKFIYYQTNFVNLDSINLIKVSSNEIKYYALTDKINDIVILNDKSLIGVSNNKKLITNLKNSNNWELISYQSSSSLYYSKEYSNVLFNYNIRGESLITKNSGVTYQTTVKTENLSYLNEMSYQNKSNYFDTFGNLVIIGMPQIPGYNNVIVSKDFGKTNTPKSLNVFGYCDFATEIIRIKDYYMVATNFIYQGQNEYYRNLMIFDSNFNYRYNHTVKGNTSNGSSFIRYIESNDSNKIFGIVEDEMDKLNRYKIGYSYDFGQTWDVKATFNSELRFVNAQLIGTDSILILTRDKNANSGNCIASAFIYNRNNNIVTNIINKSGKDYLDRIYKHNDNYYGFASGMNYIYDLNGKLISQDSSFYIKVPNYDYNNKYFIGNVTDVKKNIRTICKIKPLLDSPNHVIIEDQFPYFYNTEPYPTPSINQMRTQIFWNEDFKIDDSDIGVYDIYGNKIADKEKISINKLNSFSAYLTWDCSGLGNGVYIIQIKQGTNTHNIRAMVVR